MLSNAVETQEEQQKGLEKLGFAEKSKENFVDSIMVKNPQSAIAFIFIGRGSHTPSKSGYKTTLNLKP